VPMAVEDAREGARALRHQQPRRDLRARAVVDRELLDPVAVPLLLLHDLHRRGGGPGRKVAQELPERRPRLRAARLPLLEALGQGGGGGGHLGEGRPARVVLLHRRPHQEEEKRGGFHGRFSFYSTRGVTSNDRMSILAAALIVLAQGDPRDRLLEAIRETNVEAAQKALADLVQGDGARAARAVMASLPRARERLNVLISITQRARENYMTVDTSFGFNINEEVVKQRALEKAAARVKDAALRALEGEKVYQSILDIFAFLKPEAIPVLAAEAERTALWPLKGEILEGLGALGAKTELAVAVDRETSPAALAAALGAAPTDRGAKYLTHPQWQVR